MTRCVRNEGNEGHVWTYSLGCADQPTIMACDWSISKIVPFVDNNLIFLLFVPGVNGNNRYQKPLGTSVAHLQVFQV
jgi:hypothetical protein